MRIFLLLVLYIVNIKFTHLCWMYPFYTHWKHQKKRFSGIFSRYKFVTSSRNGLKSWKEFAHSCIKWKIINCVILKYIFKLARNKKLFIQFTYSGTVTDLENFAFLTYVKESLLDSKSFENKFTEKQRDVQLYQKEPSWLVFYSEFLNFLE